MNFNKLFNDLIENVVSHGPKILLVLGIAIIGWILALVVRAIIRKVGKAAKLNSHLSNAGSDFDLTNVLSLGGYYLVLLMALVAIASALDLSSLSAPIHALVVPITSFLPKILGALILGGIALLLATIVKKIFTQILGATKLDDKLSSAADAKPLSETLGVALYWLVILLFVPAILGVLELRGLLGPVQNMFTEFMAFLPNIVGALLIGVVGWFVARLVSDIVTNLLKAFGADGIGERVGIKELSKIVGMLVKVVIFVPALIAALQALKIQAVTEPATAMLNTMVSAVPQLIAAALIIGIAVFVGRLIAPLVANLLEAVGVDALPQKVGLGSLMEGKKLSASLGKLIFFAIVLFASVEAAGRLGFSQVSDVLTIFIKFGGDIILGVAILLIGFFLANLAHKAIAKLGGQSADLLANLARVAILGLVLAMGLGAMGVATNIVNMAFGFTLGAVAIALALSFGLGGREAAAKLSNKFVDRFFK